MARPFRISPEQAADMKAISRVSADQLKALLTHLDSLAEPLIAASGLRRIVEQNVGSQDAARSLSKQLIALAAYCRAERESPAAAVSSLITGVQNSPLEPQEKASIHNNAKELEALVGQVSVGTCAKALDLSLNHVTIWRDGAIITDIRPIFDESRDAIVGAIVSHTLQLTYFGDNGPGGLTLALDKDDVLALRNACDDAIRKADRAKALMKDRCKLETFVAGEETYA
jgi:hypothetical protein